MRKARKARKNKPAKRKREIGFKELQIRERVKKYKKRTAALRDLHKDKKLPRSKIPAAASPWRGSDQSRYWVECFKGTEIHESGIGDVPSSPYESEKEARAFAKKFIRSGRFGVVALYFAVGDTHDERRNYQLIDEFRLRGGR